MRPSVSGIADWSEIRGFNYQPSYAATGLELWSDFRAPTIETEIARGRKYFPGMNSLRLWLSWDAFQRDSQGFLASFETTLRIASRFGMSAMPVLFNRWHDAALDFGGIYIDHFYPRVRAEEGRSMFQRYLESVVGEHARDPRIFAWDLCNEPHTGYPDRAVVEAEYVWLESMYVACKRLGAAPLTVSPHFSHDMTRLEPICDILAIHPYWIPSRGKEPFVRQLDYLVEFASRAEKPLLATETCWGAIEDSGRVDIIRYTLAELKARNIGWMAHILHHSLVADAHRPEFGPVGEPGNMSFIEADGSLRPGHEVFNEF